jgi:hypothetical protein
MVAVTDYISTDQRADRPNDNSDRQHGLCVRDDKRQLAVDGG